MPYSVYVIALKSEVLKEKSFSEENPGYKKGKPCVYVGYTSKTPSERYQQHAAGARSKKGYGIYNKYVLRYHDGLRPKLYEKYNPITALQMAKETEEKLATKLRGKGYAVWQR